MLDQHPKPNLRRPRLLVSAAKHGLRDYNRDKSLKIIINSQNALNSEHILSTLIDLENQMENCRKQGDFSYETRRHVEILIAILAEISMSQLQN